MKLDQAKKMLSPRRTRTRKEKKLTNLAYNDEFPDVTRTDNVKCKTSFIIPCMREKNLIDNGAVRIIAKTRKLMAFSVKTIECFYNSSS